MDLDELDLAASTRARTWHAAGVRWEVIRWPITDNPAASLRMERDSALGELILWVSGEAELSYARDAQDELTCEHYEITSTLGLNGCLDDLELGIGL